MTGNPGATVTRIPSCASSYYTVRKQGRLWVIQLVTPAPGRAVRTSLSYCADLEGALAFGRATATRMHRPFRFKGRQA